MSSQLPRVNTQFLPIVLQGHDRALTTVKYNQDGDLLFTSSKDKFPAVWYSETGEMLGTYGPHNGTVWDIDPSWDSQYVVTACSDAYARIFETTTGKYLARCPHKGPVRACAWSDSGTQFVTASDPFSGTKSREWGAVNIFDFPTPDSLYESPTPSSDPAPLHSPKFEIEIMENNKATCLTWTYADQFIIAGFDTGMLVKYDPVAGKEVTRTTKIHSDRINQICWNKDKTLFITASKDCYSKIIDPNTFEVVKEIKTERPVNGAVISPTHPHIILGGGQDAQTVTTGGGAGQSQFQSRFYHMVYGEEFGRCKGHFGPINAMAIHPYGKSYATASEDGFVRIMPFEQSYLNVPDHLPDELRQRF